MASATGIFLSILIRKFHLFANGVDGAAVHKEHHARVFPEPIPEGMREMGGEFVKPCFGRKIGLLHTDKIRVLTHHVVNAFSPLGGCQFHIHHLYTSVREIPLKSNKGNSLIYNGNWVIVCMKTVCEVSGRTRI